MFLVKKQRKPGAFGGYRLIMRVARFVDGVSRPVIYCVSRDATSQPEKNATS